MISGSWSTKTVSFCSPFHTSPIGFIGHHLPEHMMAHHEVGRLCFAVAMLPILADTLTVFLEELFGKQTATTQSKRGPTPKLQRQIEQVSLPPRTKQKFVVATSDTVINQQ